MICLANVSEISVYMQSDSPNQMVVNVQANVSSQCSPVYSVKLCNSNNSECQYGTSDSIDGNFEFDNLQPFTDYYAQVEVNVVFENSFIGYANSSNTTKTAQGTPGQVQNLQVVSISTTCVNVSWQEPLELNGVISLYWLNVSSNSSVSVEPVFYTVGNDITWYLVDNLYSCTYYLVQVWASTGASEQFANGSVSSAVATTKFDNSKFSEDCIEKPTFKIPILLVKIVCLFI